MGENEINRLPPSLRQKQRYLKFKIHAEEKVELGDLVDAVWESALDYLGTNDASKADFWVIGNQFDEKKQKGIIRVNRDELDDFRAALTLIDFINGVDGFIQVKKISGSIDKLKDN